MIRIGGDWMLGPTPTTRARRTSKFKVLMAGLGVVVLWASAFSAIRVAAPDLGVVGLSVVRLAVASLALLAVAPWRTSVCRSAGACRSSWLRRSSA